MIKQLLNRIQAWRGTPQSREQTPGHAIYLKNSGEKDLLKNSGDFESQKLAELSRNCGKQDYERVMYGIYREHRGHRGE